jgi:hypothetical protein
MNETRHDTAKPVPFDTARLDALLEDAGIDVLVAIFYGTSRPSAAIRASHRA